MKVKSLLTSGVALWLESLVQFSLEAAIKLSSKGTILEEIIDHKKRAVSIAKQELSLEDIESQLKDCPSPRPFISPLRSALANQEPAVIAEIKKASPSKV